MKRLCSIIIVIIILAIIPIFCSCKKNEDQTGNKQNIVYEYVLKIENNDLCLFLNENQIKKYDVNISVLPGEDIKLLNEGIKVQDIADADSIAENFDG